MGGVGPRFLGRRNQTASRALEFRDGSLVQRFQDSHCFSRISTDSLNKRRSSLTFFPKEVASRVSFPSSSLHFSFASASESFCHVQFLCQKVLLFFFDLR